MTPYDFAELLDRVELLLRAAQFARIVSTEMSAAAISSHTL